MQRQFAEHLRDDPSLPLRVGIGLDVGEAVAVGDDFRGQSLNLAARLCARAVAGEVLVSEALHHIVGRVDGVGMRDAGRLRVKGFDEPMHAYRLVFDLDLPAAPGRSQVWRWLVGGGVAVALVAATFAVLYAVERQDSSAGLPAASSFSTGLYKVDATNNRVAAIIGSDDRQSIIDLTYGFGSLWVSEGDGLDRINPNTDAVTARVPVTGGGGGVAIADGRVWVSGGPLQTNVANLIDPTRVHDYPHSVRLQPFNPDSYAPWLVSADDDVWTWTTGVGDCCVGRQLWRIDGHSHRVLAELPTAKAVAAGPEGVWEIRNDHVHRIDPASNRVGPAVPGVLGAQQIAVGAGAVWVSTIAALGQMFKIDPKTYTIIQFHVPAYIGGLAAGPSDLWVSDQAHDRLLRIDPSTTHIDKIIQLGDRPPSRIALAPGQVWIAFG
jgi:hypothetical protein